MHHIHNTPRIEGAPHTGGNVLHWAGQYELFTGIFGLGVQSRGSRAVIELAKIKSGDAVLDVGCGTGSLTLTARAYAGPSGSVHGIDASPEMIETAKKKALQSAPDVIFDLGLIEKLDFPDATFDVVINRLMIHHLPDDLKRTAFAEILRVLKPGGHLLIADFTPPAHPLLNHLASALVGHGMMHIDISSYAAMLASAGFIDITSGPTRSSFLGFVSGHKAK